MTTSDTDGNSDEGSFYFCVAVVPTPDQEAECAVFDEDGPAAATAPVDQPTEMAAVLTPTTAAPSAGEGDSDGGGISGVAVIGIVAGVVVAVLVMAPYPDMEEEQIALTSWTRIDKFPVEEYNEARVTDFIDTHVRRFNPEGF